MEGDMTIDGLLRALAELVDALPQELPPFLVGGGLGLYLKQRALEERVDRGETIIDGAFWPPARSTEDLDLFLPTEVIVSAVHMTEIRETLDRLGYRPDVEHFQFVRDGVDGRVKIDLLTTEIPSDQSKWVIVKPPRVRARGNVRLHAYLTREAIGIAAHPVEVTVEVKRRNAPPRPLMIRVPNAFTYLLMKLHACRDRAARDHVERARHHAVDVYRIVAMMDRSEFDLIRALAIRFREHDAFAAAKDIVAQMFEATSSSGVLRAVEGAREAGIEVRDEERRVFVETLGALFGVTSE